MDSPREHRHQWGCSGVHVRTGLPPPTRESFAGLTTEAATVTALTQDSKQLIHIYSRHDRPTCAQVDPQSEKKPDIYFVAQSVLCLPSQGRLVAPSNNTLSHAARRKPCFASCKSICRLPVSASSFDSHGSATDDVPRGPHCQSTRRCTGPPLW